MNKTAVQTSLPEEPAIALRNVSKSFKVQKDKAKTLKERLIRGGGKSARHDVLKNISLDIAPGETVALIGVNGSGKSTLLKMMTKILYPNEGTIKTRGKVASLLELGAGFHPDFTGRENIYFNAAVFGMSHKEIDERLQDIIEFSELKEFIDEPVRTYSSGMYMRLAFSIAINVDADILLIDEILAVGDQHFQNKCFARLEELRDSETTIVIVSHSLDTVRSLCSRAIWIYKGELRMDGDPAYVIGHYLRQSALDNQEQMQQDAKEGRMTALKGVVYLDTPKNFASVPAGMPLHIAGWKICSDPDARLEILLDGIPLQKIRSEARHDVYDIYQEDYAGLIEANTIGFAVDPILEAGGHRLDVRLYSQDRLVDSKSLQLHVEEA